MQMYVLPPLAPRVYATASFDLWMSKGAHETFAQVMNNLKSKLGGKADNDRGCRYSGPAMALDQLKQPLDKFGLSKKIVVCYLKDEGVNLDTSTQVLQSVVSYILWTYQTPTRDLALAMPVEYVTTDEKVH